MYKFLKKYFCFSFWKLTLFEIKQFPIIVLRNLLDVAFKNYPNQFLQNKSLCVLNVVSKIDLSRFENISEVIP